MRAAVAAILLLALAVAACGGAAASPTASVAASAAPSVAVSSEGAEPSPASGAEDLEALIPETVGGVALQRLSMRGDEFVGSGGASAEAQEFLRSLGVANDDVSVAVGFGATPDGSGGVAIFAFRAEGADSSRLLQAMQSAIDAESASPLEWETVTVGGKEVQRAADPEQQGQTYLYVTGDLLVFVATTNEDDAAEVLGGMP
jgi:hypothetical protein